MIHRTSLITAAATMIIAVVLFTQAATAAPSQIASLNWQQRSDWVNVKALPLAAIGDGIADDSPALQAAITAMRDGATLYIPAGTYRITTPLVLTGPRHGILIVGNGRETKLVWDGEPGGKMLTVNGVAYSNYRGLSFDGRGKASIGIWHDNNKRFETEVRNQQLSFKGFTDGGIVSNPKCAIPSAEMSFEDCLFEDCRRGVSFAKFNDYDFTFSGCDFKGCDTGIDCINGNFYARDCHFEGSRVEDVHAAQEHGVSLRRCTSVGSARFLSHVSAVGTITVQDCWVDGWTDPAGAIRLAGAPAVLFDNHFTHPPIVAGAAAAPVTIARGEQRVFLSENVTVSGELSISQSRTHVYVIPPGKRKGVVTGPSQSFLRTSVRIPKRVYDAVKDFGAKADGKTDDTAAIQAAIDAAASAANSVAGKDSIAYLPMGNYVISKTLRVTGRDYFIGGGGSGFYTRLVWKGAAGGTMMEVRNPQNVVIENLTLGHGDSGVSNAGLNIDQVGTETGSRTTYDGVWVYGLYRRDPFNQGIRFLNLGAKDTVIIQQVQGNMHFVDSAAATVIANNTYEGSVVVDGKSPKRDGILGFQFRLATLVTHPLYLRDSNSIVMSDLYVEQSNSGLYFEGHDGDPAGRATIQGAKLNTGGHPAEAVNFRLFDINNYRGQIFFGHDQLYVEPNPLPVVQVGAQTVDLTVFGCCYYATKPDEQVTSAAKLSYVGNEGFGMSKVGYAAGDVNASSALPSLALALDDLRRLGAVDVALNYPQAAVGAK